MEIGADLFDGLIGAVGRFARKCGTAFQLQDDILGIIGDEKLLGKKIGSDIREGKKTLPHYYLNQAATAHEKKYLRTVFGNPDAAGTDISQVQQLLRRYRVQTRLKQDIDRLQRTIDHHITQLDLQSPAQASLRQLVTFCASRQT